MKIYIKKETETTGIIMYYVWRDAKCFFASPVYDEAESQFQTALLGAKQGLPKSEIVKSIEIENV